jgi:hydroxyacylglutathione hydrolase
VPLIFLLLHGAVQRRGPDNHVDGIWLPQNSPPQVAGIVSPRKPAQQVFQYPVFHHPACFCSALGYCVRDPAIYNETMIHQILPVGPLQCNCSIIGDEATREAMVIDPGDDIDGVLAILRKHNLEVKQIVVTHAHIDHVGGAMKLRAATGAPILLNQNDLALLKMLDVQAAWVGMAAPGQVEIDQSVGSSDTVRAGSLSANVLHTPGHTEGSICLYFPAENKLIAGDTLFAGSIGRTDLPGGSFEKIIRSLHQTVLALPDDTVVVPGHGPLTTIGEERESNPFLVKK